MFWKWSEKRVCWQECDWKARSGNVSCVAFSPDQKSVVTGSCDGLVQIWDFQTGVQVSSFAGVR